MACRFPIRPRRGTVIVVDDQPGADVGGVVPGSGFGCWHLDFQVVAVNPGDDLGFGVGSVVVLDDPNRAGDANHRRMIDGVVYRSVPVEHIVGVVE